MTDREFYNIISTIHLSFKNLKKLSAVKHPESKVLGVVAQLTPQLKNFNKDTFSICCLYTQFSQGPSSINSLVQKMAEVSKQEIHSFRDSIMNYNVYLSEDIKYLKSKYLSPSVEEIALEYTSSKIKFYTYYFYIMKLNKIEDLKKSRVHSILWNRVLGLMLFVQFKQESVDKILDRISNTFMDE